MTPAGATTTSAVRPPFAYFGGKQRLGPTIAAMLPPHTHYVEPYAGGLAVLLAKPPTRLETVNDLDGDLMHFWRILRDHPDQLARACALTPHSRAERELGLDRPEDLDDVERARRIWVCLAEGRTGTLRRTGWRFDTADFANVSMPNRLDSYVRRMDAVAHRLRGVSLECRDALDVVDAYGHGRRTLLYVDPPYLGSTRNRNYRHEMASPVRSPGARRGAARLHRHRRAERLRLRPLRRGPVPRLVPRHPQRRHRTGRHLATENRSPVVQPTTPNPRAPGNGTDRRA